jgi:hypothetical protein
MDFGRPIEVRDARLLKQRGHDSHCSARHQTVPTLRAAWKFLRATLAGMPCALCFFTRQMHIGVTESLWLTKQHEERSDGGLCPRGLVRGGPQL